MSALHPQVPAAAAPEKYLIAFVIQGDDVFKITADNIIHTTGTASGPAFDAIAKLKAAAALLELTNRHKERPDELRQMARELAGEGMKLMARASSAIQPLMPVEAGGPQPPAEPAPVQAVAASRIPADEEPVAAPAQPAMPLQLSRAVFQPGPAPLPKPQEQSAVDDAVLPGNSPTNSKIALISG